MILGSTNISTLKLGSSAVQKVMLGATEVWSAFSPLDLSPALWLSDTGSDASVWPDLSGNGRNATQGTPANRPAIITNALNGRQVRRFDGDDLLIGDIGSAISQPITIFVVAKKTANPSNPLNARVFHASSSAVAEANIFLPVATEYNGNHIWNFGTNTVTSDPFGTTNIIYCVLANGASSVIWQNGTQIETGNPGANGLQRYFSIGGRYHDGLRNFTGDIAEILVFPTALSNANRQKVESWLNNKWSIY